MQWQFITLINLIIQWDCIYYNMCLRWLFVLFISFLLNMYIYAVVISYILRLISYNHGNFVI